jgi:predicted alpha/beta-hydrolase family hydrolase
VVQPEQRVRLDDGRGATVGAIVAGEPGATAVILAHGAGGDMESPGLVAFHATLAAAGFLSVRFNFPYKERGGRAPDSKRVLETCFRAVVGQVRDCRALRPRRIVLGGKSMGGRIASQVVAAGQPADGLLFLGYPLHPAGQPQRLRVDHWERIECPMLFLQGTRDPLCRLDLLRPQLARLKADVRLHVIEGGDHSFEVLKKSGRSRADVEAELIAVAAAWLRGLG